jgi:hypothetical protein
MLEKETEIDGVTIRVYNYNDDFSLELCEAERPGREVSIGFEHIPALLAFIEEFRRRQI